MKTMVTSLIMTALMISCNKGGGGSSATPKTDDEKAFYALGAMLGGRFKDLELTDRELALVNSGLIDSARGKADMDPRKHQAKIQEIFNGRMKKKTDVVKTNGTDYLEKFLKEPGAKKTASGLAYKVVKDGKGNKPSATDTVEVHYHGTLIDGTVFDSSVERGKTVSFPLNRVIKGWTEGLQLIGEGGKVKLVIPAELGYGDHGAPPKIPGGSTLVFDVELFKVQAGEKAAKKAPKKKK